MATDTAPALKLTETKRPEVVRKSTAAPNPFDGKFPVAEDKALTFELPAVTDDDAKLLNRYLSQARKAANKAGFTAKQSQEITGTKSKKDRKVKVYIWSIPQITRPRKNDESETPETSETPENSESNPEENEVAETSGE